MSINLRSSGEDECRPNAPSKGDINLRVLIIGGYGVFGSRLARLLVKDAHQVTVAGRSLETAQSLADEIGCAAMALDRNDDLGVLKDFDVVIDAAGPFHAYGDDQYRLPKAAIAACVHYLDLSDNAEFCAGISALDEAARAANCCVISGLSSVPAVSSAAVGALSEGATPRAIETAIIPGNRSPRGRSVMSSILSQAGTKMQIWRGQAWSDVWGWSDPRTYDLPSGLTRQAYLIEVPDTKLFPSHFGAQTVIFRAGLELGIMRHGLAAFGYLRRVLPIPINSFVVGFFKILVDLLEPFGTGRGGMVVMVTIEQEVHIWRLIAEDGDGPFIPTVAARALLRKGELPVGARPALEVVTLAEVEDAMADLNVRTEQISKPLNPIFAQVLADDFAKLPEAIRKTHETAVFGRWQGEARVERGSTLWSRFLGWAFRFPQASEKTTVEVTKTITPKGETWVRRFGESQFFSKLAATPKGMTERFGPFTFSIGLSVKDGALHYPVRSGRLWFIPIPNICLPISETREYVSDGVFCFDVKLLSPFARKLVVHYKGWLKEAALAPQSGLNG